MKLSQICPPVMYWAGLTESGKDQAGEMIQVPVTLMRIQVRVGTQEVQKSDKKN